MKSRWDDGPTLNQAAPRAGGGHIQTTATQCFEECALVDESIRLSGNHLIDVKWDSQHFCPLSALLQFDTERELPRTFKREPTEPYVCPTSFVMRLESERDRLRIHQLFPVWVVHRDANLNFS